MKFTITLQTGTVFTSPHCHIATLQNSNIVINITTRLSSIESQPKKVIVVVVVVFVVFVVFDLVGVVGDVVGHKNLTLNWACNR